LQEKSIEGHTPLYWAIIKQPSMHSYENADEDDIVSSLLAYSIPLSKATISDVRLACLHAPNEHLFQRLRRLHAFAPLSGTEAMLLAKGTPPDEISITEEGGAGEIDQFEARIRFPNFQHRMRTGKEVAAEFIARGRMWRLGFTTTPQSVEKWVVQLKLLEHSPPTWLDSRLFIHPQLQQKTKPSIELRLKTEGNEMIPRAYTGQLETALEKSLMGNSLYYERNPYINTDGSLNIVFQASLARNQPECIIC